MEKYKKLRENTSKRLSLESKIPGVEWDLPSPIDRDHREAGVEWDPPPIKGVEWGPPPYKPKARGLSGTPQTEHYIALCYI